MFEQQQFLEVIDRDEAERRFQGALRLQPLGEEEVELAAAWGRVLARDVFSPLDVPGFDRSNFDGFAVQAADTYEASEESPRTLRLRPEVISSAVIPALEVAPGTCAAIATGGMVPRGADAILLVEHSDTVGDILLVRRALTPGFGVTFAGTDIASGELVVRRGELLTSRETGALAAIGIDRVWVWRKPRVGIISTGDEIIEPGTPARPGLVYDSNGRILADAVRELGGEPTALGIVQDDVGELRRWVAAALEQCDIVLLSGGTSKGAGDVSYRVVRELRDPGVLAHGVALKPGKPICLAVSRGKPVVVLPGFPTSAIFTFHEFVAPVLQHLAGRRAASRTTVPARLSVKVNSEIGRTEYLLVGLVRSVPGSTGDADQPGRPTGASDLVAYPLGKGSGSVTTFSRADGFVTIGRHEEIVPAGTQVDVQLLGRDLQLADLVVMGSHCVGLDFLLGMLQAEGIHVKFLAIGSTAGLDAVRRGECDLAGMHLLDPVTGQYNRPFLSDELELIPGYGREQGLVFRPGDPHCAAHDATSALRAVLEDPNCVMVNRNAGSGTRLLIDRLLAGARPRGYAVQPRNHNAVAAAVAQNRADWGVTIRHVAEHCGLSFLPLTVEQYDFVALRNRLRLPAIVTFQKALHSDAFRRHLGLLGFTVPAAAE